MFNANAARYEQPFATSLNPRRAREGPTSVHNKNNRFQPSNRMPKHPIYPS
ncbi:hypothetical protein RE6C_01802 [Rhodopirellula europaea 6C]|uniref:Uncharacterized protein n=1 Tax=Rhodopirellula europaea 6C TaxID=1263867 RepID=M2B4X4_9BACT|nr:hypothetical protein RE6C_01802 [Rhodopirellula europaea 6C]